MVCLLMLLGNLIPVVWAQQEAAEAERIHMEILSAGTASPSRKAVA